MFPRLWRGSRLTPNVRKVFIRKAVAQMKPAAAPGAGASGSRIWEGEATNFVRVQVANFEKLGGGFSKAEASEIGGREGHGF